MPFKRYFPFRIQTSAYNCQSLLILLGGCPFSSALQKDILSVDVSMDDRVPTRSRFFVVTQRFLDGTPTVCQMQNTESILSVTCHQNAPGRCSLPVINSRS